MWDLNGPHHLDTEHKNEETLYLDVASTRPPIEGWNYVHLFSTIHCHPILIRDMFSMKPTVADITSVPHLAL